tara:strand:+ start:379 stop:690 length:312 start_codon:yes stop_codon:yes gene_type:complete
MDYPNKYCSDLKTGWCIVTKYHGPTDYIGPRIHATVKRDQSTLWEVAVEPKSEMESVDNHRRAAQLMIDTWEFKERFPDMKLFTYGFDTDQYYFIAATPAEID